MIADAFQKTYGVPAAVVNKPGGGGGPFPGAAEVAVEADVDLGGLRGEIVTGQGEAGEARSQARLVSGGRVEAAVQCDSHGTGGDADGISPGRRDGEGGAVFVSLQAVAVAGGIWLGVERQLVDDDVQRLLQAQGRPLAELGDREAAGRRERELQAPVAVVGGQRQGERDAACLAAAESHALGLRPCLDAAVEALEGEGFTEDGCPLDPRAKFHALCAGCLGGNGDL